jgi:hypothetical protein
MDFPPSTAESISLIASSSGSNVITPGGSSQIGSYIDVRRWASYYLEVNATTTSNPATGYNAIEVSPGWAALANGGSSTYVDDFEFWADNQTGPVLALGPLLAQDVMHGPFMTLQFFNNGADSVSVTWRLTGTTRSVGQPYVRQFTGVDGILLNTSTMHVNASSSVSVAAPFTYGRCYQKLVNKNTGSLDFNIVYGSQGVSDIVTVAPNTTDRREMILPKRAFKYIVSAGATASDFNIVLLTQFDKV